MRSVRGAQIIQNSRGHLKILGARRVTLNKFRGEGPQVLGAAVQNVFTRATWLPEFLHIWIL
jgi:hypothetical protein